MDTIPDADQMAAELQHQAARISQLEGLILSSPAPIPGVMLLALTFTRNVQQSTQPLIVGSYPDGDWDVVQRMPDEEENCTYHAHLQLLAEWADMERDKLRLVRKRMREADDGSHAD